MDSVTDEYIKNYDYNDPVIPIPQTFANEEAYFVYRKGRDHWNQGVKSIKDNREIVKKFALEYDLDSIVIKPKNVKKLPTKQNKKLVFMRLIWRFQHRRSDTGSSRDFLL
jgi:hypothetical protein